MKEIEKPDETGQPKPKKKKKGDIATQKAKKVRKEAGSKISFELIKIPNAFSTTYHSCDNLQLNCFFLLFRSLPLAIGTRELPPFIHSVWECFICNIKTKAFSEKFQGSGSSWATQPHCISAYFQAWFF